MKNKLLLRQAIKYFGSSEKLPEYLLSFLNLISDTYDHYEKDRKMLERSIELSSQEMVELNSKLRKETEESHKEVYVKLKESLDILNDEKENTSINANDFLKLSYIADVLKNETKKRRLAEKERERRELQLEASQRIAHVGSWDLDLTNLEDINSNKLSWSDETFRIFGMEPQSAEVNNELFFSYVQPDDRQLIQDAINISIQTGDIYDIEHRILLPDKIEKIVHERGEIIKDKLSGKPIKILGTIQDISERKQAKLHIEKANEEIKKLFENIHEAFFSVNMETFETIQMTAACMKIYGYSPEDFIANSTLWFDLILEEDKQVIFNNDPKLREGNSIVQEYRIRDKSGQIKWIETALEPTLNEKGILVRIDGITSDITKRKEAEIALKESEYKFRFLIENSADAIIIVNKKGEITFASTSLYKVTGHNPEDVIGLTSFDITHPEDKAALQQLFLELLEVPGSVRSIVHRRMKKDGTYIWCNGTATNLLSEPAVKGVVINFRDITERIEYEEALMRSNIELKKTNMELDKFVYSVSHDLRAPLSSMEGVINFLEIETSDPQALKDIGFLKESVYKLDNFILDILDYSRNARLDIKREEINFKGFLDDIINNLKFMSSGNANIDVAFQIIGTSVFYSDKTRVGIILNNIISNAIRYSDPQKLNPFVEVIINLTDANAFIIIKDNGIGISKEHQEKIFDIFYRVSAKSEGSGLGLYIVKETIEKLNGTINIESEQEVGTIFKISIPNQVNNN